MSKQYTIIENKEGKWLQPIDVPYPNQDDYEDDDYTESIFDLADAVIYKQRCAPLPYVGNRNTGESVSEYEIREVLQFKSGNDWILYHSWRDSGWGFDTRTAYADSEPLEFDMDGDVHNPDNPEPSHDQNHDCPPEHYAMKKRQVGKPFKISNIRPLVNKMLAEEITFSRFVEILNERAEGKETD